MSILLNQAKEDLNIFFDDLSERVYLNGFAMNIVIDYDRLKDRSKKEYDGIYVGELLYFAKEKDFVTLPKVGDVQTLNKRKYEVFDIRKDIGLYEVILKGAGS